MKHIAKQLEKLLELEQKKLDEYEAEYKKLSKQEEKLYVKRDNQSHTVYSIKQTIRFLKGEPREK